MHVPRFLVIQGMQCFPVVQTWTATEVKVVHAAYIACKRHAAAQRAHVTGSEAHTGSICKSNITNLPSGSCRDSSRLARLWPVSHGWPVCGGRLVTPRQLTVRGHSREGASKALISSIVRCKVPHLHQMASWSQSVLSDCTSLLNCKNSAQAF